MKRIILLIGIIVGAASFTVAFGQAEGSIIYETKVKMRNTSGVSEELRQRLPDFRTLQDQLIFNESASLFQPVVEDEPFETDASGGAVVFRFQRPVNEYYVDRVEMKTVRMEEFLGKRYLIEDSLRLKPWKIGSETREISGYVCRQATFTDEQGKRTVVAWYTDKLRPFLGPAGYNTLPGCVMAIDVNDGERTTVVKSIDLRPLKKRELKMPSSGTPISDAEFTALREKELERIRANGGNVIIRD